MAPGRRPGLDIGMRFVDQNRAGIGGARGLQQAKVGVHRACAQPDRGVILDLAGHQDAVACRAGRAGRRGEVVF